MERSRKKTLAWAEARHQMNETLRRQAEARFGKEFLGKVILENLEDSLAAWLEPFLSGRRRPEDTVRGDFNGARARGEAVFSMLSRKLAKPALLIGSDVGAMAASLELECAHELEPWRLKLAREAFPACNFRPDDFAEQPDSARFKTIVALRYLQGLKRLETYGRFRTFFPAVARQLQPGGKLLLADGLAYQDDIVAQLAALDFEILEIESLADGVGVFIEAQRGD
jgi:hypothetical protein